MRILLSAYACAPDRGSEPGGGWNWARGLARCGHQVTVLTLPNAAEEIAASLREHPVDGLSFEYLPTPEPARRITGQSGVYAEYLAWQWAAYHRAKLLIQHERFDLVHHVSFGSLSLGSFLGLLPLPFVFGPVGGGQVAPRALRPVFVGRWRAEVVRTLIVEGLLPALPTARLAVSRAALVLAANDETRRLVERLGARHVRPMPDVGVDEASIASSPGPGSQDGRLRLLWVGRFQAHKGLPLALRAVASLPPTSSVELRIVGYGPLETELPGWIARLGLGDRVRVVGRLPWNAMNEQYRTSDALLFTSIRESGGIQMLEALAQGCPVIALDHQGARVILTDDTSLRVPVGDPRTTVAGLARAIQRMADDPSLRAEMATQALEVAHQHTWAGKARAATDLYAEVLDEVSGAC
jgi:glycosyltransferase involved in cell wall biosynthesis